MLLSPSDFIRILIPHKHIHGNARGNDCIRFQKSSENFMASRGC